MHKETLRAQRERVGLAALLAIIENPGKNGKINEKNMGKASRVVKEFQRVTEHRFVKKKPTSRFRYKKNLTCRRFPPCGGKCLE